MKNNDNHKKKIIIVGCGFGGLATAKGLLHLAKAKKIKLTVIDQKNHHLFQPLLYQVATAGLSPAEIAVPIRSLLRARTTHCEVILGKLKCIQHQNQKIFVQTEDDQSIELNYDILVLACGARHSYFGKSEWEEFAPGLKTLEQATEIRRRILVAFEKAETCTFEEERRRQLSFIIVGGGPTGVELAGAIAEISKQTLAKDFSNIDPSKTRIILVEAGKRILPSFSESMSEKASKDLERLGVNIWTSMRVTNITDKGIHIGNDFISAATIIWAAGVAPFDVDGLASIASKDQGGKVLVDPFLRLQENVFALGDMAHFQDKKFGVLPGLAPVALQQGRHCAKNIQRLLYGKKLVPYVYFDKGQMATIGRKSAVTEFKGIKLHGVLAWFAWLLVHIYYLIGFRSKVFVLLQWITSYIFFKRGARLVTNRSWKQESK